MEEKNNWRDNIYFQLQNRNKNQTQRFQDLIAFQNKLFDNANSLRIENLQLSIQLEKLKHGGFENAVGSSVSETRLHEKIQQLEQKVLIQQEELTELHKRKGENAQQIIDLNNKLQEKEKLLASKEISLAENIALNQSLRAEIRMYQHSIKELENLNQTIRDEHQALQLAFASLEEKLRKCQEESRQLVERLINYKAKDADRMNEENDNFLNESTKRSAPILSTFSLFRKRNAKVQKELEDASKDAKALATDDTLCAAGMPFESVVPKKCVIKFDAHEGEVNAVRWSQFERLVATGGADRKVKLWDISKGICECRGVLVGSNRGVMSVEFDSTGTLLLGASNDFASRVWNISDHRLRHTFTGHSGKVMAAKFLGESKVVSGSYDRTLKIWDMRSKACIETKFAGSSCNDLVTLEGSGTTIISGHFDKQIRFWDTRTEASADAILVQGKVTSLDISRDGTYLLSCVRDDTLNLYDLRKNEKVTSFCCDGFKVGCDWSRATFSPDGQYVAVGSVDGSVYVWNVNSGKVENTLKEHTSAVVATSWNPCGNYLITVDKSKSATVWGDA